jgi:hypothetical protein
VSAKGSPFIVADSKAMARVEVAWLIKTGFLFVAADAVITPAQNRTSNRRNDTHGRLRFIRVLAPSHFREQLPIQVRLSVEGPPRFANPG